MSDDVAAALATLQQSGAFGSGQDVNGALALLRGTGALTAPAAQKAAISNPTDGMSPLETAGAGFVKSLIDAARGTRSAIVDTLAGPPFAPQALKDLSKQYRQQADQIKQQDAPLMATTGAKIGNFVGQAVPALLTPGAGEGIAAKLLMSGLGGAAQGAVQPVGVDDSRAVNAGIGAGAGLVGQGIGSGLGMALRGATPASPTVAAAQQFADQNGGVLTRGQISGSQFTQRLEKMLASLPGSGNFYRNAANANAQATTRGLEAVTGGDAGKLIQQAGDGKSLTIDAPFVTDLRDIASKFSGVADRDQPNGALRTIEQYVGSGTPNPALQGFSPAAQQQAIAQGVPQFINRSAPKFNVGDQMPMVGPYGDFSNYQGLRSLYGYRAQSGDPADRAAYNLIQDALDSAAQRSLVAQGAPADTMREVQQAYAAQKIAQPARMVDKDGNVTYDPTKLASAVARTDAKKPGMIDNLGAAGQQLRQLAAFGQVATPLKSSGTAEGHIAGSLATGGLIADLLGGGGITTAAKTVGGLLATPKLVNLLVQGTRNGVPAPAWIKDLLQSGVAAAPMGALSLTPSAGLLSLQ